MKITALLVLGAVLAAAPLAAQARPAHSAKSQVSPALKSRQAAMDGFSARMGRLDALMGTVPPTRTRSASAER